MDFKFEGNRIYLTGENNAVIAEVTFPDINENLVNLNHTFVDNSLRGQGIAGMLMEAVVEVLRKQNKKVKLTCSYAVTWFQKHPECNDVVE
ncbi:MAG: GCN5-related N-acetyltransferase [Herbinix sp.]|nr:GCN5-related N-acetyltransferase [Herbinix sp.]